MQNVKFLEGTAAKIAEYPITLGALLFDIENGILYKDTESGRIKMSGSSDAPTTFISETQPEEMQVGDLWFKFIEE